MLSSGTIRRCSERCQAGARAPVAAGAHFRWSRTGRAATASGGAHGPVVRHREQSRARPAARLVDRLRDGELARPLDAGWTVGAVLAHLAFWDQRTLILIERWEKEGSRAVPRSIDSKDVDWINDSAKALCLALPPRAAARLAVAVADAVDRRVETLSDELVAANAGAGSPINLLRAEHRQEHLDEIERAFGQGRAR